MAPRQTCPRCRGGLLSPEALADQADRVRAVVEGAVALDLSQPGDELAAVYGGDTRRVLRAALSRAADLALEHARAAACLAGTCVIKARNEEMVNVMRTGPAKQFVLLMWRDMKIQAQDIEEPEIARRFREYEHLDLLLDFVSTAAPGDSFPAKGERLLRYR
jgi:hypothetical protein